MKKISGAWAFAALLSACSPQGQSTNPVAAPVAGADRDAHGCIGSAGYTWSNVRKQCIRIFEAGLAFEPDPAPTQGAVLSAYLVLAPAEGEVTATELFVPGRDAPVSLTLVHTPEGDIRPTLLENKTEGVRVFRFKDEHVLEVNGQIFRRASPPDDRLFELN
ncbi:MAG: hypothetical protein RL697_679 [Pseudomonadota bacterium]|jgi:hypothetical protein